MLYLVTRSATKARGKLEKHMKAIAYTKSSPSSHNDALIDIELPQPIATGRDLLIKVKAITVYPVNDKVYLSIPPTAGESKILGWSAVGEVVATGEVSSKFKPGDSVYYAGDITRTNINSEYQLVDERIVGHKPKSLTDTETVTLPLPAIIAWEILFEHLQLQLALESNKSDQVILVFGAASNVGSIVIQIAKRLTGATIIATVSRPDSQDWMKERGADHVIDHSRPILAQIDALNIGQITQVASLDATESYFEAYTELLAPFGKIAMIGEPELLEISKLKMKSLPLNWEFMFARSVFKTDNMYKQGELLNRISDLIDSGHLDTTVGTNLDTITAKI
jgi:zinc-binding alcohol dehydrogenase family protein